ncbi:uncharacterized protein bip1 [Calliphora vicina]|uniref:uncharacterized protein bip1 n=1 Tax=Calliphora vicina TaxID=7373 RepID=UPI00325B2FE2
MAKTRIKTTPTRMQKEALMASAAVTTTTNVVTEHVFKKRLSVLKNSITATKETTTAMPIQSTIIVRPPKRTNSISSTTSTISHTSDGSHSCADSPPPTNITITPTQSNGPTMAELTENAIKTLNAGLLAKSNALALKNRKVYMITEKCDDASNGGNSNGTGSGGANGTAPAQKRKMYLIMEEKESDKNAEKLMKTDNTNNSKKLTLFTDTTNGQLPQKFEKILPEILNCIQAKKGGSVNGKSEIVSTEQNNKHLTSATLVNEVNTKFQLKNENNERLPLTLPPKKNRTKIITTQIIPVNPTQHAIYQANVSDSWATSTAAAATASAAAIIPAVGVVVSGVNPSGYVAHHNNNGFCKPENSKGATPVIVNASTLLTANGNNNSNGLKSKENVTGSTSSANQLHKNINLSTDFLFLMKMLPKLESIEEPQKTYVKNCIEDIINQYAGNENVEQ